MLTIADCARRTARTWGVSRASEPAAVASQVRMKHDAVHSVRVKIHVRIRWVFSLARRVVERTIAGAGGGGGKVGYRSAVSQRSENANRPAPRGCLKAPRTSCTNYPNGM